MINFCKNTNCPSSAEILAFEKGKIRPEKSEQISFHLSACEFCAAEVEFYAHYPQIEEKVEMVETAEIPLPLYELAAALLGNKHKEFSTLNKLLCENKALNEKRERDFTLSL